MKLLALEVSTLATGIALAEDGNILCELTINMGQGHSRYLVPQIKQLLSLAKIEPSQLTGIAISRGPGSFTGLRVGLAAAYGLSLIHRIPLIGVDTLHAYALNGAGFPGLICPVLDAKRGEVYAGIFKASGSPIPQRLRENICAPIEEILSSFPNWQDTLFLGDGVRLYKDVIVSHLKELAHFLPEHLDLPKASNVAILGMEALLRGEGSFSITLEYLRPPQVSK